MILTIYPTPLNTKKKKKKKKREIQDFATSEEPVLIKLTLVWREQTRLHFNTGNCSLTHTWTHTHTHTYTHTHTHTQSENNCRALSRNRLTVYSTSGFCYIANDK